MLGMSSFFSFLIAFLLFLSLVTAQLAKPSSWQTLSGSAPLVVAKGGFSGIFPDSSSAAYELAMMSSKTDTILWCDVRLTKDGFGICLPDIKLDNCTNIAYVFPNGKNKYIINGVLTKGWFSVDYALKDLANVGCKFFNLSYKPKFSVSYFENADYSKFKFLLMNYDLYIDNTLLMQAVVQAIYSRTEKFDLAYGIFGVEDVVALKPPGLWLNIQHDAFYSQHLLNMTRYILSVSKNVTVNYVSSPEVDFLRNLVREFRGTKTKLVFRFLEYDDTEPTMNQKYSSLLKNLTFIKTFASGILVPKEYIWNATNEPYLLPHTSVVTDAHKVGLEVFASGFHNDAIIPFNYTYDPLAEYLNYVDNGDFSVDGVLTDHPITSSEAIDCYSHMDKNNNSDLGKPTIISYNGASSDYPDCTDLAYNQAVLDGADFIDCPVQMTKDGVPICMSSIDLIQVTTVTTSAFRARISTLPELQAATGIFVFNFTWEEIHNLKPVISSPEINYGMVRNPRFKYSGQFMKLLDFLAFAKDKALSGVTIKINNAAFLVEKLGFDVVNEVINALNSTGYNNLSTQQVMIQSKSSSVLMKFKQQTKYNLSYMVNESIGNADNSAIADIANFAHSVAIDQTSIFLENYNYITGQTQVMKRLKSAGLAVYVYVLRNEFVTHFWDFFMDPYVEINSFVNISGVDGIITDSPRTTKTYRRNTCAKSGGFPQYMEALKVGTLWSLISPVLLPPAVAPLPVLDAADVLESPLPSVKGAKTGPSTSPSPPTAPAPNSSNVHLNSVALIFFSVIMMKLTLW